jgi:hypothetical protein
MKIACWFAAFCLATAPAFAQAPETATSSTTARNAAASEQAGFFAEPDVIGRAIRFGNRLVAGDGGEVKNGFYPEFGDMISGAGWISGGPGYRHWLFADRMLVDASAALSWRMYKMAQARVEMPRLAGGRVTTGLQVRWQDLTQVAYFGEGPDSLAVHRSEYRMGSANFVGYAVGKPARWLSLTGKIGWIARPSLQPPGGTFQRGDPDTATTFPEDPVFQLDAQPNFLHGELALVADTRDHRGYPSEGGLYRVSWSSYADREIDRFSFQRYEAEAAHFVPLASHRIVLAAHAWLAGTRADEGQVVPFYFLPSLGGANTLRAYPSYRFHDRNLLAVNAEARVKLFTHVDWAAFVDAGNVAPAMGGLNLDRRSFGMGFRVHTQTATVARLDVAHGNEGWRILFRVNDPFRFSRVQRRTAPLPFVP